MEALNKILIIKGILAEKAGLDPQLYSELEVQFDELKQLLNKCNVSGSLPFADLLIWYSTADIPYGLTLDEVLARYGNDR